MGGFRGVDRAEPTTTRLRSHSRRRWQRAVQVLGVLLCMRGARAKDVHEQGLPPIYDADAPGHVRAMGSGDRWVVKFKEATPPDKVADVCVSMQKAPEIVAMGQGGSSGGHCHTQAQEVGVIGVQADRSSLDKLRSQHAQDIDFIEPDYQVSVSQYNNRLETQTDWGSPDTFTPEPTPPSSAPTPAPDPNAPTVDPQSTENWNLDRIDQADLPLDGMYVRPHGLDGSGTHLYVFDSGVDKNHHDFGSRVVPGANTRVPGKPIPADQGFDCHGHGSFQAGVAAGARNGVAPGATIHPIVIFDCDGKGGTTDVVMGMQWLLNNLETPGVILMPFESTYSRTFNMLLNQVTVKTNLLIVAAAGNHGTVVDNTSPASNSNAMTVGATNNADRICDFSNQGVRVDIFAPGDNVTGPLPLNKADTSLQDGPDNLVTQMSGTSVAASMAAGLALLAFQDNKNCNAGYAKSAVLTWATAGKLSGLGGDSHNLLLNTENYGLAVPPASVTMLPDLPGGFSGEYNNMPQGTDPLGFWNGPNSNANIPGHGRSDSAEDTQGVQRMSIMAAGEAEVEEEELGDVADPEAGDAVLGVGSAMYTGRPRVHRPSTHSPNAVLALGAGGVVLLACGMTIKHLFGAPATAAGASVHGAGTRLHMVGGYQQLNTMDGGNIELPSHSSRV